MAAGRVVLFLVSFIVGGSMAARRQPRMEFHRFADADDDSMEQSNVQAHPWGVNPGPFQAALARSQFIIGPQPYFFTFQPNFMMPFFYPPPATEQETGWEQDQKETSKSNTLQRFNNRQPKYVDESGTKQSSHQFKRNNVHRVAPSSPAAGPTVNNRRSPVNAPGRYPYHNQSQATECKADVCSLPECFCGGDAAPGGLPVEDVPQLVLLTFDDAVNDRNRDLYEDLFKSGRKNPNGCPISATFYVSHDWTDYSLVRNLYAGGHEIASHTISHSFGQELSVKQWAQEAVGQRDLLAAYAGVRTEDVRGVRAPYLSIGGDNMFKMLYDANFTYDSSMPILGNQVPMWPYTLDYEMPHDCVIPPCPTKSYPGVWEVPMVMWNSLGDTEEGKCSMADDCFFPDDPYLIKLTLLHNFERHYKSNRAPFPLYFHSTWFDRGQNFKMSFEAFLDEILQKEDVWLVTSWQALQWVRQPTPLNRIRQFPPFQCNYPERPAACRPEEMRLCKTLHKADIRYFRTCEACPNLYPWTANTGIQNENLDIYLKSQLERQPLSSSSK